MVRGALFHCRFQQQEFAEKSGQRRNAGQGNHRQGHRHRQEGRALIQPGQRADVLAFHPAHHQANHGECREHGEEIAAEVEKHRGLAGAAQRRHPEQHVAGVGNAGITEQPLQISLRDGAEVAIKNRRGGNGHEQSRPLRSHVRHCAEQHAQQQYKSRRFRPDREERRRRDRGALINIRRPDLERERGNFETQTNQHQQQTKQKNFVRRELRRDSGQLGEVQLAGRSENQRDAEHHEGRRQRAENQVLDARFERRQPTALETGEDVKRDGDEFHRDEQQAEIIG